MGITIESDLEKLEKLVQWVKDNARISKALSHPAGVSVFRDIVSNKVKSLIDRVKSLGRTLLEAKPSNSDEIRHQGQIIIDLFNKYDSILKNPQLNVARAFHQSADELQNLLLKIDEFMRYFPPNLLPTRSIKTSTSDDTLSGSSTADPSLGDLFTTDPSETESPFVPPQYTSPSPGGYTSSSKSKPAIRSPSDSSLQPPAPPPSVPPREYSDNPTIDKILDLKHDLDILRQANKYLKEQCNYWQSQVVGEQSSEEKRDNVKLRADVTHLQSVVRNLEEERKALLRELQNIRNTLIKFERGEQPRISDLHDQIRDLIVENHSIRKEATRIAFQRVEHALSSLQSQIDQLINENNDLRSALQK